MEVPEYIQPAPLRTLLQDMTRLDPSSRPPLDAVQRRLQAVHASLSVTPPATLPQALPQGPQNEPQQTPMRAPPQGTQHTPREAPPQAAQLEKPQLEPGTSRNTSGPAIPASQSLSHLSPTTPPPAKHFDLQACSPCIKESHHDNGMLVCGAGPNHSCSRSCMPLPVRCWTNCKATHVPLVICHDTCAGTPASASEESEEDTDSFDVALEARPGSAPASLTTATATPAHLDPSSPSLHGEIEISLSSPGNASKPATPAAGASSSRAAPAPQSNMKPLSPPAAGPPGTAAGDPRMRAPAAPPHACAQEAPPVEGALKTGTPCGGGAAAPYNVYTPAASAAAAPGSDRDLPDPSMPEWEISAESGALHVKPLLSSAVNSKPHSGVATTAAAEPSKSTQRAQRAEYIYVPPYAVAGAQKSQQTPGRKVVPTQAGAGMPAAAPPGARTPSISERLARSYVHMGVNRSVQLWGGTARQDLAQREGAMSAAQCGPGSHMGAPDMPSVESLEAATEAGTVHAQPGWGLVGNRIPYEVAPSSCASASRDASFIVKSPGWGGPESSKPQRAVQPSGSNPGQSVPSTPTPGAHNSDDRGSDLRGDEREPPRDVQAPHMHVPASPLRQATAPAKAAGGKLLEHLPQADVLHAADQKVSGADCAMRGDDAAPKVRLGTQPGTQPQPGTGLAPHRHSLDGDIRTRLPLRHSPYVAAPVPVRSALRDAIISQESMLPQPPVIQPQAPAQPPAAAVTLVATVHSDLEERPPSRPGAGPATAANSHDERSLPSQPRYVPPATASSIAIPQRSRAGGSVRGTRFVPAPATSSAPPVAIAPPVAAPPQGDVTISLLCTDEPVLLQPPVTPEPTVATALLSRTPEGLMSRGRGSPWAKCGRWLQGLRGGRRADRAQPHWHPKDRHGKYEGLSGAQQHGMSW